MQRLQKENFFEKFILASLLFKTFKSFQDSSIELSLRSSNCHEITLSQQAAIVLTNVSFIVANYLLIEAAIKAITPVLKSNRPRPVPVVAPVIAAAPKQPAAPQNKPKKEQPKKAKKNATPIPYAPPSLTGTIRPVKGHAPKKSSQRQPSVPSTRNQAVELAEAPTITSAFTFSQEHQPAAVVVGEEKRTGPVSPLTATPEVGIREAVQESELFDLSVRARESYARLFFHSNSPRPLTIIEDDAKAAPRHSRAGFVA